MPLGLCNIIMSDDLHSFTCWQDPGLSPSLEVSLIPWWCYLLCSPEACIFTAFPAEVGAGCPSWLVWGSLAPTTIGGTQKCLSKCMLLKHGEAKNIPQLYAVGKGK